MPTPETTSSRRILRIGVVTESASGEQRVALDPSSVRKLVLSGHSVRIESGAGTRAAMSDDDYARAGADIRSRQDVLTSSDVVVVVRSPDEGIIAAVTNGQTVLGLLDPLNRPDMIRDLTARGVTTVAFELLPRTLSRAQSMDALSSQSSAAGYRAAIVAAHAYGRYLPMMITASGTATPAMVMRSLSAWQPWASAITRPPGPRTN